jgi:SWI/SNF-related matrix-associated actin-dependent regulator of chromatin subfamily A containing DEAD/H box 1
LTNFKLQTLSDVRLPDKVVCDSGKFNELDRLLPKLKADDHRVLIFSQFTMMLDVLEHYLRIRGHKYFRLDGQTAVTERQDMINEYNSDLSIFVFLLSTRAGGLGINLTSADTVILHDIDFNPYNDKQAEDRCHRMGQTRPVSIYKFVTDSTIEEGMNFVAQEKLQLERDVSADDRKS